MRPSSAVERPDFFSSGLFLLLFSILCCGNDAPHCTFLGSLDLVSSSAGADISGMSNEAQDTAPAAIVYGSMAYNDLFHKTTLYTGHNPPLKDVTIAESPYSSLSLLIRRPHWGIAPSICLTRTYVRAESVPGNYDLMLQQNRDNAGIALWGELSATSVWASNSIRF